MKSQEYIIIAENYDMIIYLIINDQEIIAVNWMFGAGDLEHFGDYKKNNPLLREFIERMWDYPLFKDLNMVQKLAELINIHVRLITD
jgi:hypothetical protein